MTSMDWKGGISSEEPAFSADDHFILALGRYVQRICLVSTTLLVYRMAVREG